MYTGEEIRNRILCGNSMEILKYFPDESVDLIFTSPPYFGCRKYGDKDNELGREKSPLDYIENMLGFCMELKRILKRSGSFYLNIGDVYFGTKGFSRNQGKFARRTDDHYESHDIVAEDGKYLQYKQLLLLPYRIAMGMQMQGWIVRNMIVWDKLNPIPSFSPDRRLPVYETVIHVVKSKKYFFDYDLAKRLEHHRDIVRCGIEPYKNHEATFPEKFVFPFLMTTSKEEDLVLDPFVGSGTVPYVAKKNNRNYIGIDLLEENCKEAEERIASLEDTLFTV